MILNFNGDILFPFRVIIVSNFHALSWSIEAILAFNELLCSSEGSFHCFVTCHDSFESAIGEIQDERFWCECLYFKQLSSFVYAIYIVTPHHAIGSDKVIMRLYLAETAPHNTKKKKPTKKAAFCIDLVTWTVLSRQLVSQRECITSVQILIL